MKTWIAIILASVLALVPAAYLLCRQTSVDPQPVIVEDSQADPAVVEGKAVTKVEKQICDVCQGSGVCILCDGSGEIEMDDGTIVPCVTECAACKGTGYLVMNVTEWEWNEVKND